MKYSNLMQRSTALGTSGTTEWSIAYFCYENLFLWHNEGTGGGGG